MTSFKIVEMAIRVQRVTEYWTPWYGVMPKPLAMWYVEGIGRAWARLWEETNLNEAHAEFVKIEEALDYVEYLTEEDLKQERVRRRLVAHFAPVLLAAAR